MVTYDPLDSYVPSHKCLILTVMLALTLLLGEIRRVKLPNLEIYILISNLMVPLDFGYRTSY